MSDLNQIMFRKRIAELSLPSTSDGGRIVEDATSASNLIAVASKGNVKQLQLLSQPDVSVVRAS